MKTKKEAIQSLLKSYSPQELAQLHWQFEHLANVAKHTAFKTVSKILHEAAFGEPKNAQRR